MSRERFEKLFPVPEWAGFDPAHGYSNPEWRDLDPVTNLTRLDELCRINAAWHAYQFRQPEIDELVEAAALVFSLANHFHVGSKWFTDSEENCEALEALEALIAKHKGEA